MATQALLPSSREIFKNPRFHVSGKRMNPLPPCHLTLSPGGGLGQLESGTSLYSISWLPALPVLARTGRKPGSV